MFFRLFIVNSQTQIKICLQSNRIYLLRVSSICHTFPKYRSKMVLTDMGSTIWQYSRLFCNCCLIFFMSWPMPGKFTENKNDKKVQRKQFSEFSFFRDDFVSTLWKYYQKTIEHWKICCYVSSLNSSLTLKFWE